MDKRNHRSATRLWPPLLLILSLALTACPSATGPGGPPQIVSFTANPARITAPGQAVTLSWEISGGVTSLSIDPEVGPVSGTNAVVYPSAATTYTLTATNSSGTDTETVVVGFGAGPGGPLEEDGRPPSGTFGVSLTQSDFQNDQGGDITGPGDPRIVRVAPGDTFYALVSYSDPGGVAGVRIRIVNSSPPGLQADLVQGQEVGGFTLVGEVGGCVLDGTQTAVNCIYEIAVGEVPNIDALPGSGDEFAYVFRTYVTDAAGNESDSPPRGYVIIGSGGGGNPPGNRDPVAAFTSTRVASDDSGVRVRFSALESSDPDGDPLSYAWNFGDGSGASSRDYTKTYREDGTYTVSLTVSDARGGSDTATETLQIDVPGDTPAPPPPPPPPPPAKEDPVARIAYSPEMVSPGDLVTLDGSGSSDPDGGDIKAYAWAVKGPRGNTASFTGETPSFTATFAGRYEISLVVTDDEGAESEAATETITVAGAGNNRPPTVEISGGDERRAVEGVPVALVAVGDDPDDDRLSYRWTARPPSGVTFSSPTSSITRATFADNDDDDYTIIVTVTDGKGGTASDEVEFEVDEAG